MAQKSELLMVLVAITFSMTVHSKVDLTNIKCDSFDKSYVYFDTCLLKSVNRTYKYFSITVKYPRKQLINDIKVNFAMLRKENGYKPFLYNITIDACEYLKKRHNPVIKFAHTFFEKYSTINRTCPYGQQDDKVEVPVSHINNLVTNVLPSPHGEYAYALTIYFLNKKAMVVMVYGALS